MLLLGYFVQRFNFFSSETYGHDLHRLRSAAGSSASAPFQHVDVISDFGFVCPFVDLLVSGHEQIE